MGKKLLADAPGRAFDAKMLIGFGYQSLGEYDKAIPVLEDAVKNLDPNHCGANFNLATCYNGASKYDEAAKYYDRVIANPRCPVVAIECLLEKATMTLTKIGKTDEAIAIYRQIFTMSDAPNMENTAAFVKALEDVKPGTSGVDAIISTLDNTSGQTKARIMSSVARVLVEGQHKYKEAGLLYARLISENPSSPSLLEWKLNRATCNESAGNWAAARDMLQELCGKCPSADENARIKMALAGCVGRLGDIDGKSRILAEIQAEFPDTEWAVEAKRLMNVPNSEQLTRGGR